MSVIPTLDPLKAPKHVAIIMDGNRRWAKERDLPLVMGHWEGAESLMDIVKAASNFGIQTITAYSFSTENWSRTEEEIDVLMEIFEVYLKEKKASMVKEGVKLGMIGDLTKMPPSVQVAFNEAKEATKECSKINLVLAMNYGGRDEIRRAFCKIFEKHQDTKLSTDLITEEFIAEHLDTNPWGDPDLMIRTSGELRMSNFLLWQLSYSEIYITDKLWPDFSSKDLLDALIDYQKRDRRLGG